MNYYQVEAETETRQSRALPTKERGAFRERMERLTTIVMTRQCGVDWPTCPRCDKGFDNAVDALQDERWCEAAGLPVLAKHQGELARKRRAARRAGDRPAVASPRIRRAVGKGVC